MPTTTPIWTPCRTCGDLKCPGVRHVCAPDAKAPWHARHAPLILLAVVVVTAVMARLLGV